MQSRSTSNHALTSDAHGATHVASTTPSERELALLHRVLGTLELDGIEQLRAQLRMLVVAPGSDATCRIYALHPDVPRSVISIDGRAKLTSLPVHSARGHELGTVSVWVERGHLRALHYVKRDGAAALVLPPPAWVVVPTDHVAAAVRVLGCRQALAGVRAIGMPPLLVAPIPVATPVPAAASMPVATPVPAAAPMPPAATVLAPRRDPEHPPARRARRAAVAAIVATVLLLISMVAFSEGYEGGVDLDAARAEGAAIGAAQGAEAGRVTGAFDGATEGSLNGRVSTYRQSFEAAERSTRAELRAERLAAERAAAAEAAAAAAAATSFTVPTSTDNTACAGSRDASGYWVCS